MAYKPPIEKTIIFVSDYDWVLERIKRRNRFSRNQNKRLAVEDLLRKIFRKKPKRRKQIKGNTERIEKLEWEITMLY